jgi:cell wall-associated NlpC family hydrolase
MRRVHKIATLILIGSVAFAGKAAIAQAAEDPIAGITVALDDFYQNAEVTDEKEVQSILEEIETYNNLAFAQVSSYVNIRRKASEDSDIVGKLYNNCAATIISKENGWYQIKSGSVSGYIKAEFLVTGDKAQSIAKSVGTRIATVNTTTLKVRKDASLDSEVISLIPMGDDYKVAEEKDGWVKIYVDNDSLGYVSSDFVTLQTQFEEAVSIEEEQQRIKEEDTAGSGSGNNGSSSSDEGSYHDSGTSALGSRIASYAVQFQGNPYVWGGTSLTRGADCSGFTQSVFAHFGIYISRTSRTQATGGTRISFDNLRPGDLIFYARNGVIDHVAIYIGSGRVISASSPSTGIRITRYNYRQPVRAVRYN